MSRITPLFSMVLTAAFTFLPALTGCSPYALRGKVIDGPASAVLIVDQNDPRLARPGLANAAVEVTVDPQSLGRKVLPPELAGGDGSFAVTIDEFGAGALEYDARLVVQHKGFHTTHDVIRIPGGNKRVLVILAPGPDRYVRPDDPLGESQRFLPPR